MSSQNGLTKKIGEKDLNLIDEKDRDFLYNKICKLHDQINVPSCLEPIDILCESYYEKRENPDVGIREYSIDNVLDLRKKLEDMWPDEDLRELIPVILASTFKAKEKKSKLTAVSDELPEYIYNF